ncbi:uncharacterized protein LOC125087611 isoform X2 [Lutra lutra]|uniref:uncharacterized protein LOC125087611 isoform X2 n=1 Tax=Lutra lutra TaxID=9657 RepID=UPI001FD1EE90|nr:uncharacterized protein LOC125087611 isoform X2 [Lutra lutra]
MPAVPRHQVSLDASRPPTPGTPRRQVPPDARCPRMPAVPRRQVSPDASRPTPGLRVGCGARTPQWRPSWGSLVWCGSTSDAGHARRRLDSNPARRTGPSGATLSCLGAFCSLRGRSRHAQLTI